MDEKQRRQEFEAFGYDASLDWKHDSFKWQCPYNENVSCPTRRCASCGWYPAVMQRRNMQIRERYGAAT